MYSFTIRRCGNVVGKLCSNVIVRPSRRKINAVRFTSPTKTHCVSGYVSINRNYSTGDSKLKVPPQTDNDTVTDNNVDTKDLSEESQLTIYDSININDLCEIDRDAQQKLDELCQDPENDKHLQVLKLEIEVLRYDGERVPDSIRPREWLHLFNLKGKTQRSRYLQFLWRNEKKTENLKHKKLLRRMEHEALDDLREQGHIEYGLGRNSFHMRIYETTMNDFYHNNLMKAMMFEPTVVFDLGYCEHMTHVETTNCAKQLVLSFATNRTHPDPFNLYFCNADKSTNLMQIVQRAVPVIYDTCFPLNVTAESYLDIFDKDKLIYLSPHCTTELTEYDPDKIYIIGAMVDKARPQPLSLAKAKKQGIKMAKFPLERYMTWKVGSGKNLTLNQVLDILLDLRYTRDWVTALKHIPARKVLQEGRRYKKSVFKDRSKFDSDDEDL